MLLENRVALITGASRGIGKAIAIEYAREGAKIAVTYHKNQSKAEEVLRFIRSMGGEAILIPLLVENRNSVKDAVKMVLDQWNRIDILVNNAAVLEQKPFTEISDEEWDRILRVNLKGAFICCQEIAPIMESRGWGRIINIASIGGQWGGNLAVHYSASKAGLISLTRSLARIYSPKGITTNAISPGLVLTDMSSGELLTEEGRKKASAIPLGRTADPTEIARTAVFLASEDASYITGQTVNVNGGMYFG
ncbi:SDR family oxidoreductase [Paradesulfitobacterium aromaticivorans]